jgi:hypothetical protein
VSSFDPSLDGYMEETAARVQLSSLLSSVLFLLANTVAIDSNEYRDWVARETALSFPHPACRW